jgi:membrane protease YdiL (CAAX protease family)
MAVETQLVAPVETARETRQYSTGRIALYLLLAFGLAWALEALLFVTHTPVGLAGGVKFVLVADGAMLCPAIAALITLMTARGGFAAAGLWPRFKQSWKWYLTAFFLPVALVALATALSVALGLARLDWTLPSLAAMLPAGKTLPSALAPVVLIQTVVVGSLLGSLLGMGEELGWRGYLLPALLRRGMPTHAAYLVSGIIWGLWHAPLILMGYNYPGAPVFGIFLFCGLTILYTYIFGWMRLASGTAWAAALGHAAFDQTVSASGILFVPGSYNAMIATALGPVGWIPALVVVIWLIVTGRIRAVSAGAGQKAT